MAVKRNASGTRMLCVFECIARLQPLGVTALAREMAADKSAIQRDLMTLADAGWIRPAPDAQGQWELSPHVLTLARAPHSANALRQRARPVLEHLRGDTGETVYLTIPDGDHFVVIDALESFHMLRMVPPVGIVVPAQGSATARAVLPWLSDGEARRLIGRAPTVADREDWAAVRQKGYAINDEDLVQGAIAMAAPILGPGAVPLGTLVLTGPAERLTSDRREELGQRLRAAALQLSDS